MCQLLLGLGRAKPGTPKSSEFSEAKTTDEVIVFWDDLVHRQELPKHQQNHSEKISDFSTLLPMFIVHS